MFAKLLDLIGHRANLFLIAALVAVAAVYAVEPQLLAVSWYKGFLVFAGAHAGYWLDRILFPYGRPDVVAGFHDDNVEEVTASCFVFTTPQDSLLFALCMIRRAAIVVGAMICVAFGA